MKVGSVVLLLTPMLGENMHSIGVAFHDYGDGIQFIFEDGGYDGFSTGEQKDFLLEKGIDEKSSAYVFSNVINMERDYEAGRWSHVFEDSKYRKPRDF